MRQALGRLFPRWRDFRRSRRTYRAHFAHSPHFLFAKTFNEKIQRRKILDRDPRLPLRSDKVLVKDFVAEKIGPDWATPTIWHGPSLPPLHERFWPLPFVLKANHGSDMNIFVRSANDLDWPQIETLCAKWLTENLRELDGEWGYHNIKRQLLVEPFLGDATSLPIDYKFWTFHGRVEFIEVDIDHLRQTMFDRNWRPLPFNITHPPETRHINQPQSLELMIGAAETLSEGMSFVRVDLYEINETPRFGEMTFYPSSGLSRFDPPEYDIIVGRLWR
jgi:hypothetical protein